MSISYRLEERDESLESTLQIVQHTLKLALGKIKVGREHGDLACELKYALDLVDGELKLFKEMRANLAAAYLEKTR